MSKNTYNSFREKLLAQEQPNSKLQQKFQLETKKMYTETLKTKDRIAMILISSFIAFFTFLFWVLSKLFEEIQILYEVRHIEPLRLMATWAMFLSIILIGFSLWPAIRGKIGLRIYPKAVRFIFWLLILSVVGLLLSTFSFLGQEVDGPVNMEIIGIFTTVGIVITMGVYLLLSGRLDRSDIKNESKILELEYRVAELEEKLKS